MYSEQKLVDPKLSLPFPFYAVPIGFSVALPVMVLHMFDQNRAESLVTLRAVGWEKVSSILNLMTLGRRGLLVFVLERNQP